MCEGNLLGIEFHAMSCRMGSLVSFIKYGILTQAIYRRLVICGGGDGGGGGAPNIGFY
jgi:hypothetical protein